MIIPDHKQKPICEGVFIRTPVIFIPRSHNKPPIRMRASVPSISLPLHFQSRAKYDLHYSKTKRTNDPHYAKSRENSISRRFNLSRLPLFIFCRISHKCQRSAHSKPGTTSTRYRGFMRKMGPFVRRPPTSAWLLKNHCLYLDFATWKYRYQR